MLHPRGIISVLYDHATLRQPPAHCHPTALRLPIFYVDQCKKWKMRIAMPQE